MLLRRSRRHYIILLIASATVLLGVIPSFLPAAEPKVDDAIVPRFEQTEPEAGAWGGADDGFGNLPSPPDESARIGHDEPSVRTDIRQDAADRKGKEPTDSMQPPAPSLEDGAAPTGLEEDSEQEEPRRRTIVDALHGTLTKSVQATATWLDSFFGDERYEIEENLTVVKLRYDAFREEDSRWDTNPEIDARLVLPQMQKKTHLIISGSPSDDFDGGLAPAHPPAGAAPAHEERRVTTALQYFFRATNRMNLSIRVGAQLQKGSPVLFSGPRYRYFCQDCPGPAWGTRFTEELFWWTSKGWQSRTRIDLERSLPHDLFFRTSLDGEWTENITGYFYTLSFILRQPVTRSAAVQYEWSNSFETRPEHELETVALAIRYRQSFLRDWLFFEVAPQTRFPRERDFDFTPGVLFRLEAVFGRYQ